MTGHSRAKSERVAMSNFAQIVRCSKQLGDIFLQHGVEESGSDLKQRNQDEAPLRHSRMRDIQFRRVDHAGAQHKNVNVDGARAACDHSSAAEFVFDVLDRVQQLARHQIGFGLDGAIQEPTLGAQTDWLGFE